ncbi:MAG: ribonuclease HI [Planctomycetes bacterium TMED75]|nr:ribonuclease HI [Planctomycetaceae bacterium]OUU92149.1 MAG: ribonuclease HI [Planctomycetes bacterium TMED75]
MSVLTPAEILSVLESAPERELTPEPLALSEGTEAPQVLLFSDGGASPNPGPGGWAFILRSAAPDSEGRLLEVEGAGAVAETTNNRMELTAVIRGLLHLQRSCRILLVSDSQYVLKGLSEWLPGWKRKNWINSKRKPVLNSDLWKILDHLSTQHQITCQWTRGHAGHAENERCDHLVGQIRAEHFGGLG